MRRSLFSTLRNIGAWNLAILIGISFAVPLARAASEWDKIVAAAKKEGKLSIIGPQGTATKDGLTLGFMKKYPEIKMEHSGMRGSSVTAKVLIEQGARKYLTDLAVVGTTTAITGLLPAKAITPIRAHLVGPNSSDGSAWLGKHFNYADNAAQYVLIMSAYVKAPFIYNPKLVNASEIHSWKDLLNPKWKGKLALRDPTRPGGGLGNATYGTFPHHWVRSLFGSCSAKIQLCQETTGRSWILLPREKIPLESVPATS